MSEKFGKRLKKALKQAGYTQAKATEELGLSKNAITNYVSGRIPDTLILYKLANLCNVSMEWLLSGKETKAAGEAHLVEEAVRRYAVAQPKIIEVPAGVTVRYAGETVMITDKAMMLEDIREALEKGVDGTGYPELTKELTHLEYREKEQLVIVVIKGTKKGQFITNKEDEELLPLSSEERQILLKYRLLDARDQCDIKEIIDMKYERMVKRGRSYGSGSGGIGSGEEAAAKEYA